MVFMRSITTLELFTSIGIDSRTSRLNVYDSILYIYVFYGIYIIFEYLFIHRDRFREPMIDLHAPYVNQGMETGWNIG